MQYKSFFLIASLRSLPVHNAHSKFQRNQLETPGQEPSDLAFQPLFLQNPNDRLSLLKMVSQFRPEVSIIQINSLIPESPEPINGIDPPQTINSPKGLEPDIFQAGHLLVLIISEIAFLCNLSIKFLETSESPKHPKGEHDPMASPPILHNLDKTIRKVCLPPTSQHLRTRIHLNNFCQLKNVGHGAPNHYRQKTCQKFSVNPSLVNPDFQGLLVAFFGQVFSQLVGPGLVGKGDKWEL